MLNCEGNMDRALNWNGCANCLLNSTHSSVVPMLSGISVVVFTRERRSSVQEGEGNEMEKVNKVKIQVVQL